MEQSAYDFEAEASVLRAILEKAKQSGVEYEEAVPSTSVSKPLHSPLTGAEIKEGLEIAILVFKSGAAAAAFITALKDLLGHFGKNAVVRVTDRKSRKESVITAAGATST